MKKRIKIKEVKNRSKTRTIGKNTNVPPLKNFIRGAFFHEKKKKSPPGAKGYGVRRGPGGKKSKK